MERDHILSEFVFCSSFLVVLLVGKVLVVKEVLIASVLLLKLALLAHS